MKVRNTKTPPKANRARRGPNTSKPVNESQAALAAKLLKQGWAADEEHAAHVAKLVKLGIVKLAKGGPPLPEILRPGPRFKGDIQKALRWARDDS